MVFEFGAVHLCVLPPLHLGVSASARHAALAGLVAFAVSFFFSFAASLAFAWLRCSGLFFTVGTLSGPAFLEHLLEGLGGFGTLGELKERGVLLGDALEGFGIEVAQDLYARLEMVKGFEGGGRVRWIRRGFNSSEFLLEGLNVLGIEFLLLF